MRPPRATTDGEVRAMEDSNRSRNRSIHEVSDPQRRQLVAGALGAGLARVFASSAALLAAGEAAGGAAAKPVEDTPLLGFASVPPSTADTVIVPDGYVATPAFLWGEPVGLPGAMPEFRPDAGNSAAEQAAQFGMHHDGMAYFALDGSRRGLLAINHEYVDDGLLHADGLQTWSAEKLRKSQAAHGVSVIEIEDGGDGDWRIVRPSRYARRITPATPMAIGGPAAGHPLLRTALDPDGRSVLGTLSNCAGAPTPWGTFLTCEENFIGYFRGPEQPDAHGRRWGLSARGYGTRWHEHDARFDAVHHPNEPNRFGWVVEIDPFDPGATPLKRSALGRAAHEGATVAVTRDGRAVVYMGEDARFEYVYKFVTRDRIRSGGFAANRELLDHGRLYVARFDAGGRGRWLPLAHGRGPLTADNGFADAGAVLVKTRQAADLLGGTKMDRPEWIAVAADRWVYCALTHNRARGTDRGPAVDAANPRADNTMGHIIRWREAGDFDALRFDWNHFVLAGDAANERLEARGNVRGDAFACPDGLWIDARGVLWIQTDMGAAGGPEQRRLGNNAMLAADPRSGEIRRFLVGPRGAEITGATTTPDGRTLFVNIQHPGEPPDARSDPRAPSLYSSWPEGGGARPRSATVIVRRRDGGPVGT
jgi:secreted PhoX family phosphatase